MTHYLVGFRRKLVRAPGGTSAPRQSFGYSLRPRETPALHVILFPVPLGRRGRWPAETQVPWEPPEISESEVNIDEKT